jgi:hypothetical protein
VKCIFLSLEVSSQHAVFVPCSLLGTISSTTSTTVMISSPEIDVGLKKQAFNQFHMFWMHVN